MPVPNLLHFRSLRKVITSSSRVSGYVCLARAGASSIKLLARDSSVSPLASGASSIPMVWYSSGHDPYTGMDVGDALPWVGRGPEHDATIDSQQSTSHSSSRSGRIGRRDVSAGCQVWTQVCSGGAKLCPHLGQRPAKLARARLRPVSSGHLLW